MKQSVDTIRPGITIRSVLLMALAGLVIGPAAAGTFGGTLSWQPPTVSLDGSELVDLAGYRIHFGQEAGSYSDSVDVNNPGLAAYSLENLDAGTWYFSVSAYDVSGNEGPMSNPVVVSFTDDGESVVEPVPSPLPVEPAPTPTNPVQTSAAGLDADLAGSSSSATGLLELILMCGLLALRRQHLSLPNAMQASE